LRAEAKKPIKSRKTGAKLYANTASKPLVAHPSSASADFDRFRNFKAIKIPENESFPGFFYIRSICSVFKKSDRIWQGL